MRSPFIQSTEDESVQCCLVYDNRTGEVVHIHQFVGQTSKGSFSKENREEMAIEAASQLCEKQYLEVYHLGEDVELNPNKNYKIDLKSKSLLAEDFDLSSQLLREAIAPPRKL